METVFNIIFPSPLGPVALSGTETKVTALTFDSADSTAALADIPELLSLARQQLEEYFAGSRRDFDLPLEQPGTEFQQRVWRELLAIPFGETITYGKQAERIGNPTAVRAVGMTNGRNKIAIIVPCHRVIGSDGSLTGYACGLERKRWLLDHEAGIAGASLWGQCKYGREGEAPAEPPCSSLHNSR